MVILSETSSFFSLVLSPRRRKSTRYSRTSEWLVQTKNWRVVAKKEPRRPQKLPNRLPQERSRFSGASHFKRFLHPSAKVRPSTKIRPIVFMILII